MFARRLAPKTATPYMKGAKDGASCAPPAKADLASPAFGGGDGTPRRVEHLQSIKIMINDSISDLFTRIRNACLVRRDKLIIPYTKINKDILRILMQHGFIQNFQQINKKKTLGRSPFPNSKPTPIQFQKSQFLLTLKYKKNRPAILQLKRLSRPGCRLYVSGRNIPKVCEKSQLSVLFLSTSRGVLSDREAYNLNLGGEILGFVT